MRSEVFGSERVEVWFRFGCCVCQCGRGGPLQNLDDFRREGPEVTTEVPREHVEAILGIAGLKPDVEGSERTQGTARVGRSNVRTERDL